MRTLGSCELRLLRSSVPERLDPGGVPVAGLEAESTLHVGECVVSFSVLLFLNGEKD